MSKSLLDLLNKTRGDIASKRGNNVDLTRLKDGNNYLRIFPNKDDQNGVFFQTFGMHYVKHQNEEGKEVTTAYICEQHTHNRACQLCEMVMQGRALPLNYSRILIKWRPGRGSNPRPPA